MASHRNPTPNCFSSILHRLLCSGSIPTHPSDHLNNSDNFKFPEKESQTEPNIKLQTSTSPGIVARLMGLDSLPPNTNWVPKQTTLESLLRSRSVNFVDYLPQFDQTHKTEHRRVRTSVSFREDPAFFHQENHDFFVLCFEKPVNKINGGIEVYERETEKGFEGINVKKKTERSKKKEKISEKAVLRKKSDYTEKKDKPNRAYGKTSSKVGCVHGNPSAIMKSRSPEKIVSTKQVSIQASQRRKKRNQNSAKKVAPESVSENPSQVVEVHDCRINIEASKSDSGLMGLEKAKSSSKMVNWDYPSSNIICNSSMVDDQQPRTVKNKEKKPLKTRETDQYYIEMSSIICRLTEEDQEKSNWVAMDLFKFEGFKEICIEFGNHIVELVLNQLVDELVGLHLMKNLA